MRTLECAGETLVIIGHTYGSSEILRSAQNDISKIACRPAEQMKVRVQFYAQLREVIGVHEVEVEIPQGATVRELLDNIYAQKPALLGHDKSILVGAGLEFVDRNHKLNPGEEISIMPPVQGG